MATEEWDYFLPKTGTQLSVGEIGALTSGTTRGGGHPHSEEGHLTSLCIKSTQGVRAKPIQILIKNVQVKHSSVMVPQHISATIKDLSKFNVFWSYLFLCT